MPRMVSALLLAFVPGVMAAAPVGPDRPTAPSEPAARPGILAELAEYGCRINVKALNKGSQKTAISRDSQVRSGDIAKTFGAWRKLNKSVWIDPGQTGAWYYDMDFGCNIGRGYRFVVKRFDAKDNLLGEYVYYYPSQGGHTAAIELDLGDLNRFF